MTEDYIAESYRRHASHFDDKVGTVTPLDGTSIDGWRHQRLYETIRALALHDPAAQWLTVGDGRHGRDARYLQSLGLSAKATDIAEALLKEAKEAGALADYAVENAEQLSFPADSFDYVFCKESYHHFPRPTVALYEMLRIARRGVVLVEPIDPYVDRTVLQSLFLSTKDLCRWLLGHPSSRYAFEAVGNFVNGPSRRELEKIALSLGLSFLAFKGINDWTSPAIGPKPCQGWPFLAVRSRLAIADLLACCGLRRPTILVSLLCTAEPSPSLQQTLETDGFELRRLPANPYDEAAT